MAGHSLFRLREQVINKPHFMHPASFETIVGYLNDRCSENFQLSDEDVSSFETSRYAFNKDLGVATLNIDGPLTYKPTMFQALCGGTSYEQLKEDFEYLADSGAHTVAFMVSSGGGEAYQLFPTASYIRQMATDRNIKLLAFVDGLSASAAYGLTSIADEVILAPSSEVGSIGVVVRLMNDSQNLKDNGYERTFITAGDSKVPYDAEGKFRDSFLQDLQEKVDLMYEEFTGFVAEHRGIPVSTVRSTEAKTFLPQKALELGLADNVMTLEEFYEKLANSTPNKENNSMLKSKIFNMKEEQSSVDLSEYVAKAQFSELELKFAEQAADLEAALSDAITLKAQRDENALALTAAQEQLAVFQAEKEVAELATKQAVAQARMDKLSAAVGTERAAELSASLEGVSEAQFEAVVSALEFASQGEKQSALFTEMGADADVKVETNPSMEDALDALIKKQRKTK